MRLVLGDNQAVAHWASTKLKIPIVPPFEAMGIVDDEGVLCGAFIFSGYNTFNVEVTVCGRGCIQRRFIRACFDYAFNQLGVLRLTCRTKRSNKRVCDQLNRSGFKYEGTLKQYFGPHRGDDAIMYALFRQEASRWIGEKQ